MEIRKVSETSNFYVARKVAPKKEESVQKPTDSFQILGSPKESIEIPKAIAMAQPDIRADKIEEIKEKIKNGYYLTDTFIESLAEKIAKGFLH